ACSERDPESVRRLANALGDLVASRLACRVVPGARPCILPHESRNRAHCRSIKILLSRIRCLSGRDAAERVAANLGEAKCNAGHVIPFTQGAFKTDLSRFCQAGP